MPETCVVHLVRAANGIEPFSRFIQSYRRHPSGQPHDLLLIIKGFHGEMPASYQALVRDIPHRTFSLPDQGFDVRAYFLAAQEFPRDYYFCLNSFSEILDRDWLVKILGHARRDGIGLVGATGSCESLYTARLRDSPPFRHSARKHKFSLRALWNEYSNRRSELAELKRDFDPFPNYHVRSNGFMLSRRVLLKLRFWDGLTKQDAYLFESGRMGLTPQVSGMNLRSLVVGRDGRAYEKDQWGLSRTFRSGGQDNLLVGDNRTRDYAQADAESKLRLATLAWGEQPTDGRA